MVVLARQLYFEAVKVGDELPPLVKSPVDRVQVARYAGASGDFGPLHVDEPFAKNAGFPSVLVPGMIAMGFLGELAVEWLRGARLRRFTSRFVKIIWPGDVITSRGRVADRRFEEGGQYLVDIELWAENQRGELVVRGVLSARLYYNAEDEARQRAGQPPLLVKQAEEEERLARLTRGSAPPRPALPSPRPAPAPPLRPAGAAPPPARPAAPAPPAPAPATRRVEGSGSRPGKKPVAKKPSAKKAPHKAAKGKSARKATPARSKGRGKRR